MKRKEYDTKWQLPQNSNFGQSFTSRSENSKKDQNRSFSYEDSFSGSQSLFDKNWNPINKNKSLVNQSNQALVSQSFLSGKKQSRQPSRIEKESSSNQASVNQSFRSGKKQSRQPSRTKKESLVNSSNQASVNQSFRSGKKQSRQPQRIEKEREKKKFNYSISKESVDNSVFNPGNSLNKLVQKEQLCVTYNKKQVSKIKIPKNLSFNSWQSSQYYQESEQNQTWSNVLMHPQFTFLYDRFDQSVFNGNQSYNSLNSDYFNQSDIASSSISVSELDDSRIHQESHIKNKKQMNKHKNKRGATNLSQILEENQALDETMIQLKQKQLNKEMIQLKKAAVKELLKDLALSKHDQYKIQRYPPKKQRKANKLMQSENLYWNFDNEQKKSKIKEYFQFMMVSHESEFFYLEQIFGHYENCDEQIVKRFTILPQSHYQMFQNQISDIDNHQNYFILDLSSISINSTNLVKHQWRNIVILDLENSQINDLGWATLTQNLLQYHQLRMLILKKNMISNVTKSQFDNFYQLRYFEMLNLEQNELLTDESKLVISKITNQNHFIDKFKLKSLFASSFFSKGQSKVNDQYGIMTKEQIRYIQRNFHLQNIKIKEICDLIKESLKIYFRQAKDRPQRKFYHVLIKFLIKKKAYIIEFMAIKQAKISLNYEQILDFLIEAAEIWFDEKIKLKELKQLIFNLLKNFMQQFWHKDWNIHYEKIIKLAKYYAYQCFIFYNKEKYPSPSFDSNKQDIIKSTKAWLDFFFDVFLKNITKIFQKEPSNNLNQFEKTSEKRKALNTILSYEDEDVKKLREQRQKQLKKMDNQKRQYIIFTSCHQMENKINPNHSADILEQKQSQKLNLQSPLDNKIFEIQQPSMMNLQEFQDKHQTVFFNQINPIINKNPRQNTYKRLQSSKGYQNPRQNTLERPQNLKDYQNPQQNTLERTQSSKGFHNPLLNTLERPQSSKDYKHTLQNTLAKLQNSRSYQLILKPQHQQNSSFITINKKRALIGRQSSCTVCIRDTKVGRFHAEIIFLENKFHLIDSQSTTGTFIKIIGIAEIQNGMILQIEGCRLGVKLLNKRPLLAFQYLKRDSSEVIIKTSNQKQARIVIKQQKLLVQKDDESFDSISARIFMIENRFYIEDMGTLNGIWRKLSGKRNGGEMFQINNDTVFRIGKSYIYSCRIETNVLA